ncbi:hypothetical protein IWQ60_010011 [Tieghemiomyces parasiticus]|uniref:Uncharacterized protein n=1 Tax=Tieghemiomyces parasiticus TaxID=78921 RepID=A0A9W8DNE8_9FUNG|nr:hypothetical protein IWQ60_010011 [Tieghemiomyces parasiticus]
MRYLVHLFLLAALAGHDQVACSQLEVGNSGANLGNYPVVPTGLGYRPTAATINSFDLDSDIDRQAQDPLPFMSSEFWDETVLTIPDYHPSLDTSAPGGRPSSTNREDEQVPGMELDSVYHPPSRTEKRPIGDLADQGVPKKHRWNPSPEEAAEPRQRATRPSQSNSSDNPSSANTIFDREISRLKILMLVEATGQPGSNEAVAYFPYTVAADVDAVPQLNCDDLVNRLRQPKPFSIRQLPLYGNLRNTLDLLLGNSLPVAISSPRVALKEVRENFRAKLEDDIAGNNQPPLIS